MHKICDHCLLPRPMSHYRPRGRVCRRCRLTKQIERREAEIASIDAADYELRQRHRAAVRGTGTGE